MQLTDPLFWLFLVVAIFILYRRMRSKGSMPIRENKPIVLKGDELISAYTLETPLICLLEDGKIFGSDFHDKILPTLPHEGQCQCRLQIYTRNTRAILNVVNESSQKENLTRECDISSLEPMSLRYYKYSLIANHKQASQEQKEEYTAILQTMSISPIDKQKIHNHIQLT